MGKIYTKLFFSFPSSFIFPMVTPLHFAHFDHFAPCDMSQCIKNLDRILNISQIIFVTPLVLLSVKLEHNIISIGISCVCYT
jgi:hypothetical protein